MKQERVELHLHTNMSAMDGVSSAKKLIRRAAALGHRAVAITDHGVVQAFPEAMRVADTLAEAGEDIKILYGVEAYYVDDRTGGEIDKLPVSHLTLLAQNQKGLRNLYRLISVSHLRYCYRDKPLLPRSELASYREGLLAGSACKQGELFRAVAVREPWERLREIAGFYDYLEIQPIANNQCLLREGLARNEEELQEFNRAIVQLGEELGIPVCATGDAHFCMPEDVLCRRILRKEQKCGDADAPAPLFFRTTDEMLAEFDYLGEDKAYEVVVKNPNLIADRVQRLRPIPESVSSLHIGGAEEMLGENVWNGAKALYGDPLPGIVKERLEKELSCIIGNGHATQYVIAQKLVRDSMEHGYPVMSRGGVGASLAAHIVGITEVNPLAPHYLCPSCRYSEFITDGSVGSGFDLPQKTCPNCGRALRRDGQDIPSESFLGSDGEKTPDIDLNFSDEYQSAAYECLQSLFGKDRVLKAGTIRTVPYSSAERYVTTYAEKHGLALDEFDIQRLVYECQDVKCGTGCYPAGVLILPDGYDVYDFTPVQYPANSPSDGVIATHFSYQDLLDTILKMDIISHLIPTTFKYLEEYTGIPATDVPTSDPTVYSLLTSSEALGVTLEEIHWETGTLALPELGTEFARQILTETQPKNFSHLMQVYGLSCGTGVWTENAQELIKDGVCTLSNVIATRDGILNDLIRKGMTPETAYEIMEIVRKGRAQACLTQAHLRAMRDCGVPEWYLESCRKIRYLFPKAHAAAYMIAAIRMGWYKIHYPAEYYAAWFTVHHEEFDGETVINGKDAVRQALVEICGKTADDWHEEMKKQEKSKMYKIAYEAMARGIAFLPPDPEMSHTEKFLVEDGKIRLPLSSSGR